ncbi:MAG TPA: threonine/serine exporter family protein [Pseudonocardia sp.]
MPDDFLVLQVLDLAMRIGEVVLSSGEGVAETTALMLRLADAGGLPTCEVDITFTSITMSCHRGMAAPPVTTMRLVRYRSLDLTRLTQATALVERVESGELTFQQAATELDTVVRALHPYPRWVATLAWAGMAASVAVLLGGSALAAAVTFGATAVIDRVGRVLNRMKLPMIFQQVTGAMLATGITATLLYFGLLPDGTRPQLVVAAAITVLLSGLSVVGAVRDAVDGFFLTAAGRAGEIAMFSAGLLGGVVLALKAGLNFGVEFAVAGPLPAGNASLVVRGVAAGLAAGLFALAGYSPMRFLPAAAACGAAGWVIYTVMRAAMFGPVVATAVAAVGLGACSGLLHRWSGIPRLVVTLAGITPLLPGLTAYQGFYQLAVTGVVDGLVTVMVALAIGLALASGVAFGEWLTTHISTRVPDPMPSPPGPGSK